MRYVEKRTTASGIDFWAFVPKRSLREALGVSYRRFETMDAARLYSEEVLSEYEVYRKTETAKEHSEKDKVIGLVKFYRTTYEYKKLTDNSRTFYDLMISTALSTPVNQHQFANLIAANVTPTTADSLYEIIADKVSVHRAVHTMKVLRKIWYVGRRHGLVDLNPFERMGIASIADRKVLWTPDQVFKFIDTADRMGRSSIGTMALLCYDLCQRPTDMRLLRRDCMNSQGVFRFKQGKTHTLVEIPASERLLERLRVYSTQSEHIVLSESTNQPYDPRLFAKWFSRIRETAGLPEQLQMRDLRRTGATEMAESGCTEDELRSVTGHQSRDVLSIYVRPTVKLAASGINKRFKMSPEAV